MRVAPIFGANKTDLEAHSRLQMRVRLVSHFHGEQEDSKKVIHSPRSGGNPDCLREDLRRRMAYGDNMSGLATPPDPLDVALMPP